MAHGSARLSTWCLFGALTACQCGPAPVEGDAAIATDAGHDASSLDAHPADANRPPLSRGVQWVRDNPMFISALTVNVGAPPVAWVNDYFDAFHATAAHLWANGVPIEEAGWASASNPHYRWVSWVASDGTSYADDQVIGGLTTPPPGRIGYQIGDEPADYATLLSWQPGIQAVHDADPQALLILNLMRDVGEYDRVVDTFVGWGGDVVSYDDYDRANGSYRSLARYRAAGLRNGVPYWRYLRSFSFAAGNDPPLTESDLRWDAFSGLVYGYTGHSWFIYQIDPSNPDLVPALFASKGDFNSPKTASWSVVAQINAELVNLGRAVTQLTSTDVRYRASFGYTQPEGTQAWSAGAGADPYLIGVAAAPGNLLFEFLIGFFFDDADEHYAMVQNVRHNHGDWPTDSNDSGTARLSFDFGGAPVSVQRNGVQSLDKLTGNVVDVAFTSVQGDSATLDVQLAAGDVFLFKYATGAAFARQ